MLGSNGIIFQMSFAEFMYQYEVRVILNGESECRHQITKLSDNAWKLVTHDYSGNVQTESKVLKSHSKAVALQLVERLADVKRNYIQGFAPMFYRDINNLAAAIFNDYGAHDRMRIANQQDDEISRLLLLGYCLMAPADQIQQELAAYKQVKLLQDLMNQASSNVSLLSMLRVQKSMFDHLYDRLKWENGKLCFDGKVIILAGEDFTIEGAGAVYEAAINGGLSHMDAINTQKMGNRMIQIDQLDMAIPN